MDLTCGGGGTQRYKLPNIIELKKFHMILTGLTIQVGENGNHHEKLNSNWNWYFAITH